MSCHCTVDVAGRQKNIGILGFAESGCRVDQRVENPLQIKRRAANDLEHVGGGGLLLQRVREQLLRLREFACSLVKLLSQVSCGESLTGGSGLLVPRLF